MEEIKKATNFDTTRKLIEQYEDSPMGTPQRTPQRGPQTPVRDRGSPATPQTPQQQQTPPQGQQTPAQPGSPGAAAQGTPHAPGHLAGKPDLAS